MNMKRFTAALSVLALAIAGLLVATPASADPGTLAVPDTATVQLGATSVSIMVLDNDTLPIGPSSLEVVVAPAHGTAAISRTSADFPIPAVPEAMSTWSMRVWRNFADIAAARRKFLASSCPT